MRRKRRLLIVEDNADLRRLFAIGLNQRGYEVRLAANGGEAIDRVAADRPDLIILDLMMPVMDGWEVIERVNRGDAATAIPVIVVSAREQPSDRALPPCIQAWIPKPATLDQIASEVEAVLGGRRASAGLGGGSTSTETRRPERNSVESAEHGDDFVSHPRGGREELASRFGAAGPHRS